jgi:hypothetical protein
MEKEKKVRQYRSRQGRSDKQYSSNMKMMSFALVGMLVGLLGMIISSWLNG